MGRGSPQVPCLGASPPLQPPLEDDDRIARVNWEIELDHALDHLLALAPIDDGTGPVRGLAEPTCGGNRGAHRHAVDVGELPTGFHRALDEERPIGLDLDGDAGVADVA